VLFLCFFVAGTCVAASGKNLELTKVEMEGKQAAPTLVLLQQEKDGSNQILNEVPEEYIAAVPYFLEYLHGSIEEAASDLQEQKASALVVTYAYPDNLEINILSDKREKIVKKISPDEKLHDLRIRSATLMINFIKGKDGSVSNNIFVGFQLFHEDVDYIDMNVVPDYDIQKGSWILVWEKTISVRTKVYETAKFTVIQTIRTILTIVLADPQIRVIGAGGIIVAVRPIVLRLYIRQEVKTVIIPKNDRYRCECFNILPPPPSPVQRHNPRVPCGKPFYRSRGESCPGLGRQLYPDCHQCN
jgi:hypothetical protein